MIKGHDYWNRNLATTNASNDAEQLEKAKYEPAADFKSCRREELLMVALSRCFNTTFIIGVVTAISIDKTFACRL